MTPFQQRRRQQLRDLYGFDFPDDLFGFWELATRLRPLEPWLAFLDPLDLELVGPFDVLAGRFDGRVPRHSPLLHWRYYNDPPELFTVLAHGDDGLHWGYHLDDPPGGAWCLASCYNVDALEMTREGGSLFEAVRFHLEETFRDCLLARDLEEDPAPYEQRAELLSRLREQLAPWQAGGRPETGEAYVERYRRKRLPRDRQVVARTVDGLGIVCPAALYRPLSLQGPRLWRYLWKKEEPATLLEEAWKALEEGFPGTALELGRDLWAIPGRRRAEHAVRLLEAAYQALGRPHLLNVLRAHVRDRDRPWLDVLRADEEG